MAGDRLDLDVVFNLAVANGRATSTQLNDVAKAAGRANTAGNITDKTYQNVSKAQARVGDSAKTAASGQRELNDVSQRYAQYDMASTLLTVAGAMAALGTATVVAFAQQEKAFTETERIVAGMGASTDQIATLRDQLQSMSEEVPLAFSDLSSIAAFGAALDIPAESLAQFTDTVGRFAALTGTTTEEAGKGIARLAQYTKVGADGYENLGSAILYAGNSTIATEQEVLRFSQAISPLASRASVSADQIVAMAAATASFASINVEGAGSAFSRVFANIERDVASGGEGLQAFADMAGLSAQDFSAAWEKDAGATFNRVLKGLNGDIGNLVLNMDNLGIRNERDRRVVQALAINYDKYSEALSGTNEAFREGTFLSESYAYIADDLASKWQTFLNALTNTAAAIGATVGPSLVSLLTTAQDLIVALGDFVGTPIGQFLTQMAGFALTGVTAFLALRGGIALATASSLAFRSATATIGTSVGAGLTGLVGVWRGVGTAAEVATKKTTTSGRIMAGSMNVLRKAGGGVVSLFGGPWGIAITAAIAGFTALTEHARKLEEQTKENFRNNLLQTGDAVSALTTAMNAGDLPADAVLNRLRAIAGDQKAFQQITNETGDSVQKLNDLTNRTPQALENLGDAMGDLASTDLTTVQERFAELQAIWESSGGSAEDLMDSLGSGFTDSLKELASSAGMATDEQTLLNLAMGDTGTQSSLAAQGLAGVSDAVGQTADEAEELASSLSDALDYLSQLVGAGRGVSDAQADLSSAFNDAYDATQSWLEEMGKAPDILTQNSDAAIAVQNSYKSLGDSSRDMAEAVLRGGGSFEEARDKYWEGRDALMDLMGTMDIQSDVAEAWADDNLGTAEEVDAALHGVSDAMAEVEGASPTQVTIQERGADYVQQKLRDVKNGTESLPDGWVKITQNGADAVMMKAWAVAQAVRDIPGYKNVVISQTIQSTGADPGTVKAAYASGGYTGRGGMYEPAGTVHRGEYVIPKKDVNQRTGLPYADALQKLTSGERRPRSSYAQGGYVNPSPALTIDYQALAAAVAAATPRTIVADGREIARVVNNQDSRSTRRGAL